MPILLAEAWQQRYTLTLLCRELFLEAARVIATPRVTMDDAFHAHVTHHYQHDKRALIDSTTTATRCAGEL